MTASTPPRVTPTALAEPIGPADASPEAGGAVGQITPGWQVLGSLGYLDPESLTQNTTNDGRRLTLSPKFLT